MPSTSGEACALRFAAEESSAEVTHAGTCEQAMLHQETAQPLHPKTSQHREINIQLSSPALYKVCQYGYGSTNVWEFNDAYATALLDPCAICIMHNYDT